MTASVIYACSKEAIADTSGDNNTELLDKITALEDKLKLLENKLSLVEKSVDSIENGNNNVTRLYGYIEEYKREKTSIYYNSSGEETGTREEYSYDDLGRLSISNYYDYASENKQIEYVYNGKEVTLYSTGLGEKPSPRRMLSKTIYY